MPIRIVLVVGARPNLMKIAPIMKELSARKEFEPILVHTGQHYDASMSGSFFSELGIKKPDYNLGVGSAGQAEQTARIMLAFEKVLEKESPDYVLVVGDVNSTVAASLVAAKREIPIIHVEAGLRSFDLDMPEEVNRILTDRLSSLLYVTEAAGVKNLKDDGITKGVELVGNVMIDTLVMMLPKLKASMKKPYAVVTLHRPSNVDTKAGLEGILKWMTHLSKKMAIVWPVHPRTKKSIAEHGVKFVSLGNLRITEPLPYTEFMGLVKDADLVVTDSGGIQEETTYLGVPCITARDNTERPVTCELGTNILAGTDPEKIIAAIDSNRKEGTVPKLWDGHTSKRIVDSILKHASSRKR